MGLTLNTSLDALNILLAFGIGALCGLIPFAYGFLTKHKILATVSIVISALAGAGFEVLEKSPFTAIGVAVIFVVFLFAKNKSKHAHHEDDEEDYTKDE